MLLAQQGGYTKKLCFLCEWDSRERGQDWAKKKAPGTKNDAQKNLIPLEKVLLLPLHIKLGVKHDETNAE